MWRESSDTGARKPEVARLLPPERQNVRSLLGDDALIKEAEAAEILCVSLDKLREMRKAGEIPAGRMGKRVVYSLGVLRRVARRAVAA